MHSNVLPLQRLIPIIRKLKKQGKRVALTNGCFDLLHVGHLGVLEQIKRRADVLVVAINTDASVRRLNKGPGRPVVPASERARLIAALKPVDWVTLFSEETPLRAVRALKPDLLAKGADWKGKRVVGRTEVESWGGRAVLLPYRKGRSTTALLRKIQGLR